MIESYGCYSKDDRFRALGSSGGIFAALARHILQNGGIVVAARYNKDLKVVHDILDSDTHLDDFCGSKYCASDIGESFITVYNALKENKKVMFVGSPCQCAGLKSYLSIKHSEMDDNLLIVDFVCHGIPSPLAWEKYIDSYNEQGYCIESVNMRYKGTGWSKGNYSWKIIGENGERWVHRWSQDLYMKGYISNLYLRPCCYSCKFKGLNRSTDITLADYWGVWELNQDLDDDKGTSMVLINSGRGKLFFDAISNQLVCKKISIDEAVPYNRSIIECPSYNSKRSIFFDKIRKGEPFEKTINELTKISVFQKAFYYIKHLAHSII